MDRKEAFTQHYKENLFRGELSKSGPGSDPQNTYTIRTELIKLLTSLQVNVLLDAPCGDFYWMKDVLSYYPIHSYYGVDIVSELIENNNKAYQTPHVRFIVGDIVEELYPDYADMMLCRDCLVHLSFASIYKVLQNFAKSKIKYLVTTTFTRITRTNLNFEDGTNWFPINLTKHPFNLTEPSILINEQCVEKDPENDYADKSLGVWTREEISSVVLK
jgi:hypothetical protein